MYNIIKQNNVIHNNYHYKLIDNETGEILLEDTVYNTSDSSIYIAEVRNNAILNTTFGIEYIREKYNPETGEYEEEEEPTLYSTNVTFFRVTPSRQVDFNVPIEFSSDISFPADNNFIGTIQKFLLGKQVIVKNESGEVEDVKYWSEASASIEKTASTRLELSILVYITAAAPSSSSLKLYDKSISSILNIETGAFPTPGPRSLGLSTMDINDLPSPMKKLVPTILTLPTVNISEYDTTGKGSFSMKNPVNSDGEKFFIPGVGSIGSGYGDASSFNVGSAYSIVYSDIGASILGSSSTGENPLLIPIIKFNKQLLTEIIENATDIEHQTFYYFASVPPHCTCEGCYVNGEPVGAEVSFTDPAGTRAQAPQPIYVGLTENEKVPISNYRSSGDLLPGTYYAHYIYGGYWEPPQGSPVCPNYLYFAGGSDINNMFTGENINCIIQGRINTTWYTILTSKPRTVVKTDEDTSIYEEFRAIVSAPSTSSTNYYVAPLESSVIQRKSYDPNVLCIGNSAADFSQVGISVTGPQIVTWNNALGQEGNVSGYTVSLRITPQSYYKAANSLTYLKYGIVVQ